MKVRVSPGGRLVSSRQERGTEVGRRGRLVSDRRAHPLAAAAVPPPVESFLDSNIMRSLFLTP